MKKNLSGLLICFLLVSLAGHAQIDIKRYTTATDTFYWKRYIHIPKPPRASLRRFTVSRSSSKVEEFINRYAQEFTRFQGDSSRQISGNELKKQLYPVDINGDNLADMIFCGNNSIEPDIVRIWLNRRDSFELIFEDYGYLSAFRKSEGKLAEIQIGETGSGNEYLYFTRNYHVNHTPGETMFIRMKQVVACDFTEEPSKYYDLPVQFTSRADTMLLRASAALLNEPFNPSLDTFGNIIAKYRTKSRGVVLAYKSNGKGNDWFFVEMTPAVMPSASILYGTDKMPTFIRGWVSSQSIRLEQ